MRFVVLFASVPFQVASFPFFFCVEHCEHDCLPFLGPSVVRVASYVRNGPVFLIPNPLSNGFVFVFSFCRHQGGSWLIFPRISFFAHFCACFRRPTILLPTTSMRLNLPNLLPNLLPKLPNLLLLPNRLVENCSHQIEMYRSPILSFVFVCCPCCL